MRIDNYLKENNISLYRISKDTNISYPTVYNLLNGKSDFMKCSYGNIKKIANLLRLSVQDFEFLCKKNYTFTLFASEQRHLVKRLGQISYIISVLETDQIHKYWNLALKAEALYLLSMVDYLSRLNDIPLCSDFEDIRPYVMSKPLYPIDVLIQRDIENDKSAMKKARDNAIKEFLDHNIIECDISV